MGGAASQKYASLAPTISKALQAKGLPAEWTPYLMELTARESSWNPSAQNQSSTAYGLFQFLNDTWKNYGHSKSSDPYQQALAGVDYITKRYGDPIKALQFWDENKWY